MDSVNAVLLDDSDYCRLHQVEGGGNGFCTDGKGQVDFWNIS